MLQKFFFQKLIQSQNLTLPNYTYIFFKVPSSVPIFRAIQINRECSRARYIAIAIFISSIVYCIPFWFIYEYSASQMSILYTRIGKDPLFNWLIHYVIYMVAVYLIPVTVLSVINLYLVNFLIRTKKKRKSFY